jgi:hypothetical protein
VRCGPKAISEHSKPKRPLKIIEKPKPPEERFFGIGRFGGERPISHHYHHREAQLPHEQDEQT